MPYAARGSKIDRRSPELYPPMAQLGVVSDRRIAALISADGTVRWLCLPNYDGGPIFGCLLDSARGGHWRLGPGWANL
jgi:alpha,alpha-trehalase